MDHIKDLLAEVNDQLMSDMLQGEIADHLEQLMREHMEPVPVSGLGRPYPDAHRIKKVSRSGSPYHVVTK